MENMIKAALAQMTLEEKVGQMLVTGFPDGTMNDSFLQLVDRKSTRLNSSHSAKSRMPSSA